MRSVKNVLDRSQNRVVIIGGGPGGYEAALIGAQLGADVMLIERDRCGGSAVLTDVVPSKSLIATAEVMGTIHDAGTFGLRVRGGESETPVVPDLAAMNERILGLADAQASDIHSGLVRAGVKVIKGTASLVDRGTVHVAEAGGTEYDLTADTVLISVGAHPRELPTAVPDGERILSWTQLYALDELPPHLVVVGSGVTGAEFASAYRALGSEVTLVSSRDRVLPGEDEDAAEVLEEVFRSRGMNVLSRSRAESVERDGEGVVVTLADGCSDRARLPHCLMAVGSIPNTEGVGLGRPEWRSRNRATSSSTESRARRCPASTRPATAPRSCRWRRSPPCRVAIAMFHALGDAVVPLRLRNVASNVFTSPEIATVGFAQSDFRENAFEVETVTQPLHTNAPAKMLGITEGFVKIFCRRGSGSVMGGVVVGPRASDLILPITMAVENRLTVDQLAQSFVVYPSLTGSLTEAARKLHHHQA